MQSRHEGTVINTPSVCCPTSVSTVLEQAHVSCLCPVCKVRPHCSSVWKVCSLWADVRRTAVSQSDNRQGIRLQILEEVAKFLMWQNVFIYLLTRGVNHKFHQDTILYWFFGQRYDICDQWTLCWMFELFIFMFYNQTFSKLITFLSAELRQQWNSAVEVWLYETSIVSIHSKNPLK